MGFPAELKINAWTGPADPGQVDLGDRALQWGLQPWTEKASKLLAADEPADLREWHKPEVGWGLVLPDNDGLSIPDRARGVDAPEPIRELVANRGNAPIFRYTGRIDVLTRYYEDGAVQPTALLSASKRGTARGHLPYYMLIYGSPDKVPWRLQYILNQPCFTGRLHLQGAALENYVNALLNNWDGAACRPERPVVWGVDHGKDDITWLMRCALAKPVFEKFAADEQILDKAVLLSKGDATAGALANSLKAEQPALIVSTSHGLTSPTDDAAKMAAQLGAPVDQQHAAILPGKLLGEWSPDGAIWFCHACCSAGSDESTSYDGLLEKNSSVDKALKAVAALGSRVSPLPSALLGADKPLRAFVGQVEPTFDWTLRSPETGQVLTSPWIEALYNHMYRKVPEPVGMAFQSCFSVVGELLGQWAEALEGVNDAEPEAEVLAARLKLTARDRESMVILGDPTATLPGLA